jgi:hypothetical protein
MAACSLAHGARRQAALLLTRIICTVDPFRAIPITRLPSPNKSFTLSSRICSIPFGAHNTGVINQPTALRRTTRSDIQTRTPGDESHASLLPCSFGAPLLNPNLVRLQSVPLVDVLRRSTRTVQPLQAGLELSSGRCLSGSVLRLDHHGTHAPGDGAGQCASRSAAEHSSHRRERQTTAVGPEKHEPTGNQNRQRSQNPKGGDMMSTPRLE